MTSKTSKNVTNEELHGILESIKTIVEENYRDEAVQKIEQMQKKLKVDITKRG